MQTSLTPSAAQPDEQTLLDDVAELAEKEGQMASYFADLSERLEARGKELEALFPMHSGLFTDAALTLSKLKAQVDELAKAEAADRQASPEPDWERMEEQDRNDPITPKSLKRPGDTIKKVYKRLAQACHPDKTDDKRLHAIFTRAKDARDRGDLEELQELALDLELHRAGKDKAKEIPDLLDRLLSRRARLSKQIASWRFKTSQLRKTPLGQVYAMTEHDHAGVKDQGHTLFKTFLLDRVGELEKNASTLRQQLLARGVEPIA